MWCITDFPASILRGINGPENIWMVSPSCVGWQGLIILSDHVALRRISALRSESLRRSLIEVGWGSAESVIL